MNKAAKTRLLGGLILLFNLWLIGEYNITGFPVLLLTVVFAVVYEFLIVKTLCKKD
jgi:hypothetical protein